MTGEIINGIKAGSETPRTAFEAVQGIDLSGKVFLVTGAYSRLGAVTTRALLTAGATVIVAGRNPKSHSNFVSELTASDSDSSFDAALVDGSHTVDLASLASVRDFASSVRTNYDRIDCHVNNAGVMNTPYGVTEDGFEIQMGTNVIGPFLLSKILADITTRQVWLSSEGHTLIGTQPGNYDHASAPRIELSAITELDERSYDGESVIGSQSWATSCLPGSSRSSTRTSRPAPSTRVSCGPISAAVIRSGNCSSSCPAPNG